MLLMTGTNLFSVGSYGEFEYWFAGIKVAAILVFLVLGGLYVLGVISGDGTHFSNLTAHGGFLPNGVGAIFSSVVVVVFSMVARRSPPSPRPSHTTPRRPSPGRPTPWCCASARSTSARCSCSPA